MKGMKVFISVTLLAFAAIGLLPASSHALSCTAPNYTNDVILTDDVVRVSVKSKPDLERYTNNYDTALAGTTNGLEYTVREVYKGDLSIGSTIKGLSSYSLAGLQEFFEPGQDVEVLLSGSFATAADDAEPTRFNVCGLYIPFVDEGAHMFGFKDLESLQYNLRVLQLAQDSVPDALEEASTQMTQADSAAKTSQDTSVWYRVNVHVAWIAVVFFAGVVLSLYYRLFRR